MSEKKLVQMTVLNDQSLLDLDRRIDELHKQGWRRYKRTSSIKGYYTQTLIKPVSGATDTPPEKESTE